MKKVYYIAFYVLLLSFPGICRADFEADRFFDCAGMQVPLRIIFKTSYGQLIHDVSTEEKSILNNNNNLKTEKLYLNSSYNSVQPYGYVTLTSALTEYISNNKTCIIPETIEVFIGYRDPMIYIAKEFRSKPCEFSVMLRHQQVHQQINIYTLQYLLLDFTIAKELRLGRHHILLHTKIGIGNGPEILHPPLAEAAFCQLAVLGRLMAPE